MEHRRLCCISVSFAARIIGAYTMSTSILLINVLVSNFFSRNGDDDFFESIKTWTILGVNWLQALRYTHLQKKAQAALVCFLVYAISFLLASAYLALGSISMYFGHVTALYSYYIPQLTNSRVNFRVRLQKRHTSAVPWMYLQMINVIDQTAALANCIIYERQSTLYLWYTTVCSVYLIMSIYFWMVVEAARNQWYDEQNQTANNESSMLEFETTSTTSLKSPSFLSQNFSMFESSRPPMILPK